MNEDMAVTKLLTDNKVTELRNLGAFVYRIKCQKTEQRLEGIRTCLKEDQQALKLKKERERQEKQFKLRNQNSAQGMKTEINISLTV